MSLRGSRGTVIWVESLATISVYVASIWLVHIFWIGRRIESPVVGVSVSFALVQLTAIVLLIAALWIMKVRKRAVEARSRRLKPMIDEALAGHATGEDRTNQIRRIARRYPEDLDRAIGILLGSIRGRTSDRIAKLAVALGIADRWWSWYQSRSPERRRIAIERLGLLHPAIPSAVLKRVLEDENEEVRLEAARALIRSEAPEDLDAAFTFAVRENALVRALLADELAQHVIKLSEVSIPRLSSSREPKQIVAALEMLRAWGLVVTIPDFGNVLTHPDAAVRAAAVRILPYISGFPDAEGAALAAMGDGDPRVRRAAAVAAGALGAIDALPRLQTMLRGGDELALVSATAIARLGPAGEVALEQELLSPNRAAASAAMEALEKIKLRRISVG